MTTPNPTSAPNPLALKMPWLTPLAGSTPAFELARSWTAFASDIAQRSVLYLDVMRRRGNNYRAHLAEAVPNVLSYEAKPVLDGREFERPVNYLLFAITPPPGVRIDPNKRPFVVVDPRAGHGPGIGGFKADSEIGEALGAGHPCYFIGFLPEPMPGQTLEDVARAEARFLERVIELHPEADGKPCVIGNCQAGWAVAMLAAIRPELFGPLILAGSPLSYWTGVPGFNSMRYTGGMTGGSWVTAFLSDLGAGKFDGARLVENFENLNPANTLWKKPYSLFATVDTGAERYLDFERWWGGHVKLTAAEMQFIVDELFIGNKLASGDIATGDGTAIDLRNIRSPIVVFCSKGDNITPPPQALDWILALYDSIDDIRACGQTIIYCVHESAGHLGIFVSAGVARKEYGEFASNIDLIDLLPPGLYEAKFDPAEHPEKHVGGAWIMRCEARTLDDIRALGGNSVADDRQFAAMARISEINLALYRMFAQPAVRALANPAWATLQHQLEPIELRYELFSDANPLAPYLKNAAEFVREHRQQADLGNPFVALQEQASRQIVAALDAWRDLRDGLTEKTFRAIYGSPLLQAAVGIDPQSSRPLRKAPKSALHRELLAQRIEELKALRTHGGLREAAVRALLYVTMPQQVADERAFNAARQFRRESGSTDPLRLADYKALVRQQFEILLLDPEAALATLPRLLPEDADARREALSLIEKVIAAQEEPPTSEVLERLRRIGKLFVPDAGAVARKAAKARHSGHRKSRAGARQ